MTAPADPADVQRYRAITRDGSTVAIDVRTEYTDDRWRASWATDEDDGRETTTLCRSPWSALAHALAQLMEDKEEPLVEALAEGEPTRGELLAGMAALAKANPYVVEENGSTWCQYCGITLLGEDLIAYKRNPWRVVRHRVGCAWVNAKALLAPAVTRALIEKEAPRG